MRKFTRFADSENEKKEPLNMQKIARKKNYGK